MKIMGAPIYFDSYKNSYCYKEEVEFTFGFVNRNEMVAVNGGQGDLSMIEHLQLILELNKKIC